MESVEVAKKPRAALGPAKHTPVRVTRETRRKILVELGRLNKKEFGRKVKADDLISLALTLLEAKHYAQLQDATLNNADRLERRYQEYVKQNGPISKDAYIGRLLEGGAALHAPIQVMKGKDGAGS